MKRKNYERSAAELLNTLYRLNVTRYSYGDKDPWGGYRSSVGVKDFINRMYNRWVIPIKHKQEQGKLNGKKTKRR